MRPFSIRFIGFLLLAAPAAPAVAGDVSVRLDAGAGFSVKDATGAVERLRVDEATGNVSRNGALFVHTTGNASTFVGLNAGNTSMTGTDNSAFGLWALRDGTTGSYNSAFGARALQSNTTGPYNSAFGVRSLFFNSTGLGNSAFGFNSLMANSTGANNAAFGTNAMQLNYTGSGNAAFGRDALRSNTVSRNSAFGENALRSNTTGIRNAAFGADALRANTTASDNSAFGEGALYSNTIGIDNAAFGTGAMRSSLYGRYSVAFGADALASATYGTLNTAIGAFAMRQVTSGQSNTGVGAGALDRANGSFNTAVGMGALNNLPSGSSIDGNIALGAHAGNLLQSGSGNIYIANRGAATETGQIKIGTVGAQTQATIAGIHGNTSAGGIAVLVNATGVLGTTTSSARFKQDVRDMGDASDVLMRLRPVTFRYREDTVGAEESKATQYGLIAEEVAEVAPELVAPDLDGKPYSVKYHVLPALLLAQNQEQQRTIEEQRALIAALSARVERLEAR